MLSLQQKQMLCCIIIVIASYWCIHLIHGTKNNNNTYTQPQSIRNTAAKDVYGDIYNTVWFKHYTGVKETVFDYIKNGLFERIYDARNIYGHFTAAQNAARVQRACKIDNNNRIINFLRQMRTGQIIWDAAHENGWNIKSASFDFYHVLIHFVDEFESEWIRPLSDDERRAAQGLWPDYPNAYQCLDGSHFHRRRSKTLPEGFRRREMYCYKHKYPEGQNVQCVVTHQGIATQVLTGVPGAMNDRFASRYVCNADWHQSTLVDDGYPEHNPVFIRPDDSDEHSDARSVVERYLGRLKMLWKMVGSTFCRSARWHSLAIRAAFILTNMVIIIEGEGLNN